MERLRRSQDERVRRRHPSMSRIGPRNCSPGAADSPAGGRKQVPDFFHPVRDRMNPFPDRIHLSSQ
jgi:hypothetical protein